MSENNPDDTKGEVNDSDKLTDVEDIKAVIAAITSRLELRFDHLDRSLEGLKEGILSIGERLGVPRQTLLDAAGTRKDILPSREP